MTFKREAMNSIRRDIQFAGFDRAEAVYPCNIPSAPYSHNLEWIVHHAEQFIEDARAQRKPFFGFVGWTLPHSPDAYGALQRSVAETPLGPPRRGWPTCDARDLRERVRARALRWREHVSPLKDENRTPASYHDLVALTWIDMATEALLSKLDRLGCRNTTLVAFTSDHGSVAKYSCMEGGLRVPLLLQWPQRIPRGSTSQDLVSHLDLLPSILTAAGFSDRATLKHDPGHNIILSLARQGTSPSLHGHVVCETYMERAIISRNHKLIWRAAEPWRAARPATPQQDPRRMTQAEMAACSFGELAAYAITEQDRESQPHLCLRPNEDALTISANYSSSESLVGVAFARLAALLKAELNRSVVRIAPEGLYEGREMHWVHRDGLVEIGRRR